MANTTEQQIKERPILFSGEMVRAILEGRKTQTRRVVNPQPDDSGLWNDDKYPRSIISDLSGWNGTVDATGESRQFKCPYGKPGDRLWVRETWNRFGEIIYYKADEEKPFSYSTLWKPSIFMPRSASRILLEITDIRVERLHDISADDEKKEGIYSPIHELLFWALWQKINGPESWDANPWVWVITFKKIIP